MNVKSKYVLFSLIVILIFSVTALALADGHTEVTLNPDHVGVTNSQFGSVSDCPTPPAGQEDWYGWHFVLLGNYNFTSLSVTFANAGTFSADPFPGGVFIAHPDNSHAYIWTPTDDTLLAGSGTRDGDEGPPNVTSFNLSHVCPRDEGFEHLDVSKTANTSFTREHFWDIDKSVSTQYGHTVNGYSKVWLYIDGSGNETATWTVDVSYEGYVDSNWNVSGAVYIDNTGTLDAVITSVDDVLAGQPISVDCGVAFPYTLPVGESLTCTYSEDGYVEGSNEVTVTTERDTYSASAAIVWGAPTTEINKTVNISDWSDLFGNVHLGTATAPNGATFTYHKPFAWADYGADGCGSYTYGNTATIVETGQSDSATLKVNVQCYVFESAWAKGDPNEPFCNHFANWGWTNLIGPGNYEWPLWAGAGQCDTNRGTWVGTVSVSYDGTNVVVTYNVGAPFLLTETHVYAGTTMFPVVQRGRNTAYTVAPGQYTNNSPFSGEDVYVIAHGVVGIPDPNFGP